MENSEKMALTRYLFKLKNLPEELQAKLGVKTIYLAADKDAAAIRKEMDYGKTD